MFDNDYWLGQIDEPVIEPELEIVDAHYHFALLPNVGPRGPRVFRLARVRWAGFTG